MNCTVFFQIQISKVLLYFHTNPTFIIIAHVPLFACYAFSAPFERKKGEGVAEGDTRLTS